MITERDLQEAIAECEGQRSPNANTCIMLAAFYTIRRELFGNPEKFQLANEPFKLGVSDHSMDPPPVSQAENIIDYPGDSEFARIIDGREAAGVWSIIEELMETLRIVNPRLYNGVIRELQ